MFNAVEQRLQCCGKFAHKVDHEDLHLLLVQHALHDWRWIGEMLKADRQRVDAQQDLRSLAGAEKW